MSKLCERCKKPVVQTDLSCTDANSGKWHIVCADISLAEWAEQTSEIERLNLKIREIEANLEITRLGGMK